MANETQTIRAEDVGAIPASAQKDERQAASDAITQGAQPCPDCSNPPLGIAQGRAVAGLPEFKIYEVGCRVCRDHRAIGATPAEAVLKWNAAQYLPPKPEGEAAPAPPPASEAPVAP